MSLASGKRINGRTWDVIPIGEDVIDRVHVIAEDEGQLLIASNFVFEWKLGGKKINEDEGGNDEEEVEVMLQNNIREVQIIMDEDEGSETSCDTDDKGESSDDEEYKRTSDMTPRGEGHESDSDSDDDNDDCDEDDDNAENNLTLMK